MERLIYLDTHVVVWLYTGELSLFPKNVLYLLEEKNLGVSPIVQLELQFLLEIGRIKVKPEIILRNLEETIGLKVCSQEFKRVVLEALKQTWTRDPFDRLIVAQANLSEAHLITKDETILQHYKRSIWSKAVGHTRAG